MSHLTTEEAIKIFSRCLEMDPGSGDELTLTKVSMGQDGTLSPGVYVLRLTADRQSVGPIHYCPGTMLGLRIPRNVRIDLGTIFGKEGSLTPHDEIAKLLEQSNE